MPMAQLCREKGPLLLVREGHRTTALFTHMSMLSAGSPLARSSLAALRYPGGIKQDVKTREPQQI